MKSISHFFLITIFLIQGFIPAFSQAIICGQVKGKAIEAINVLMPINGFSNETVYRHGISSKLAEDSTFKITVPVNSSYFVKISLDDNPFWLVLSPGDSVFMRVDFSNNLADFKDAFKVSGSNAAGIFQFNKLNVVPFNKFIPIHDLLGSETKMTGDSLIYRFTVLLDKQILPFDSLLGLHVIDSNFYTIIKYSLKNILLFEFVRKTTGSNYYNKRIPVARLIKLIDNEYNQPGGIYNSIVKKSYFNELLYETYFNLKELERKREMYFVPNKDTTVLINAKQFKLSSDFADKLSIDSLLIKEEIWGTLLYSIVAMLPTLLNKDDLGYFNEAFPNSIYARLIDRTQNEASSAVKNGDHHNEKIIVVDSTGKKFNRLSEITDLYKNKEAVYIDLWASWCVPCKYEFNKGKGADSLMAQNGIRRVYISIDDQKFLPAWRQNIYSFNLEGNHFIAGEELQKNIKNIIYTEKENFSIPRYILVNKAGKIVNGDAPRPSSIGELNKAIVTGLGLKKN